MSAVLLFCLGFLFLFAVIELLQKQLLTKHKWARKATHILSGGIIFLMPYWLSAAQVVFLAVFFTLLLSVSKWKKLLSLHEVDRYTIGEILYPLSIGAVALISLPRHLEVFQASCLILALSDGLAGTIGEAWDFKTLKLGRNKKSLGGALVFFLCTISILSGFYGFSVMPFTSILLIALILTLAEFMLIFGSDNLFIPVLAAWLILSFL